MAVEQTTLFKDMRGLKNLKGEVIKLKKCLSQEDILNRFEGIFGMTQEDFIKLYSDPSINIFHHQQGGSKEGFAVQNVSKRITVEKYKDTPVTGGDIYVRDMSRPPYGDSPQIVYSFSFILDINNSSFKEIYLDLVENKNYYVSERIGKVYTLADLSRMEDLSEGNMDTINNIAWDLGRSVTAIFGKVLATGKLGFKRGLGHSYTIKAKIDHFKYIPLGRLVEEISKTLGKEEMLQDEKTTGEDGGIIQGTVYVGSIKGDLISPSNFNQKGEKTMAQRKTVKVQIFDDSTNITDDMALVFSTSFVTSETDNSRIIQQVLLEEAEEINVSLGHHNDMRGEEVDIEILERTGLEVFLRPVQFKDLRVSITSQ